MEDKGGRGRFIVKRMRFLVAILIIWLFFFYNIERLSRPVNLTKVAYLLVPFIGALIILIPRLRELPLWLVLVTPVPVFLALKMWSGARLWGSALSLTVTEVCVIGVTTILARWVSNAVGEFEDAIANISIGESDKLPDPFSVGQAEMYKELRRARHYQRPMALIAVGVEEESMQVALDRMVQQVQQAMIRQYVLSDVAKRLCDGLEDYNIIARQNDHFLVLLPEVTSEELPTLTGQLRQAISEQVGVDLQIGASSFPDDAVTFESLVERAVNEIDTERSLKTSRRSKSLATERRTA